LKPTALPALLSLLAFLGGCNPTPAADYEIVPVELTDEKGTTTNPRWLMIFRNGQYQSTCSYYVDDRGPSQMNCGEFVNLDPAERAHIRRLLDDKVPMEDKED
jgi:hypothetical protein